MLFQWKSLTFSQWPLEEEMPFSIIPHLFIWKSVYGEKKYIGFHKSSSSCAYRIGGWMTHALKRKKKLNCLLHQFFLRIRENPDLHSSFSLPTATKPLCLSQNKLPTRALQWNQQPGRWGCLWQRENDVSVSWGCSAKPVCPFLNLHAQGFFPGLFFFTP